MIIRLDDNLINKIAAGEVIERPSSVVKELVENSIDAGADEISITLFDSGMKTIKVADNGLGMNKKDAFICFERHTTSKLKSEEDLRNIRTLGFRGEALASIAAVSNMTIITKTKEDIEGVCLEIEAGKLIDQRPYSTKTGTTIQVNNLFFNTPVRKKYLESHSNELKRIIDVVQAFGLGYENIFFKLTNDSKVLFNLPKTDFLGRIINIFGLDLARNIFKVEYIDNEIKIEGYISKPAYTKSDRSFQYFFINKRLVQCKEVSSALYDAYHSLLFTQRHPVAILRIELDPKKTDVNVHPQKIEIRIDKNLRVYEKVFDAIREAIKAENLYLEPTPEIDKKLFDSFAQSKQPKKVISSGKNIQDSKQKELLEPERKYDFFVLGQLHKCFIIVEDEEGLAIYDQHVVHERINYEILMKKYQSGGVTSQALMSPITIELPPSQALLLSNRMSELISFGIEIEEFGKNTFLIRSLPVVLGKQLDKDVILDIVDELAMSSLETLDEIKEAILTRIACRSAVKKGEVLTNYFMGELIRKLKECELPYTCPHGRPAVIRYTLSDLEKIFKRT